MAKVRSPLIVLEGREKNSTRSYAISDVVVGEALIARR